MGKVKDIAIDLANAQFDIDTTQCINDKLETENDLLRATVVAFMQIFETDILPVAPMLVFKDIALVNRTLDNARLIIGPDKEESDD